MKPTGYVDQMTGAPLQEDDPDEDAAAGKACGIALGLIFAFVVGGSVGSCTGYQSGRSVEQDRAIFHGVARYELNPNSGRVEFRYVDEANAKR